MVLIPSPNISGPRRLQKYAYTHPTRQDSSEDVLTYASRHVPDPDCDHLHRFKDELEGDPIGRVWDGEVLEGWVQRPKGEAVAAHDMKTNGQKRHSKCGLDVANATLFQDCQERDTLTNESYIA